MLEDKIKLYEGRFSEFMNQEDIKRLRRNAFRKAIYVLKDLSLGMEKKDLVEKVVYLCDLRFYYEGCFNDNNHRSEQDQTYTYRSCPIGEEEVTAEFKFPAKDLFFREKFPSPFYSIKVLDCTEARLLAREEILGYQKMIVSWMNLAEGV